MRKEYNDRWFNTVSEQYYDGDITYKEWKAEIDSMENDNDLPYHKVTFKYKWYHIPTGKSGTNSLRLRNRMEFLEAMNKWNSVGNNEWVYTEV